MVAIVDYGAGNIKSVENAVRYLGHEAVLTRDPAVILSADHVILPGVGAFGDAMTRLSRYGLDEVLRKAAASGTPFLGICLGLQLLFESSEESPGAEGLGIFPNPGRLFAGLPEGSYVYFVHSYYLRAADPSIVTACTQYGVRIDASVESGNVFACQFHPEKSEAAGMKILQNFLMI